MGKKNQSQISFATSHQNQSQQSQGEVLVDTDSSPPYSTKFPDWDKEYYDSTSLLNSYPQPAQSKRRVIKKVNCFKRGLKKKKRQQKDQEYEYERQPKRKPSYKKKRGMEKKQIIESHNTYRQVCEKLKKCLQSVQREMKNKLKVGQKQVKELKANKGSILSIINEKGLQQALQIIFHRGIWIQEIKKAEALQKQKIQNIKVAIKYENIFRKNNIFVQKKDGKGGSNCPWSKQVQA